MSKKAASFEKSQLNLVLRAHLGLGCVALAFTIIGIRLWYLQIVRGEYYREQSENNRLKTVFIPPPRGTIRDRNGIALVENRPAFNIELVEEDTPNPQRSVKALASVLGIEPKQLLQRMKDQRQRRKYEPKLLVKDASRDDVARVAANRFQLPGIIVSVIPARNYLFGELGAHILGYIREITSQQLESSSYAEDYRVGDLVGQYGLEARWERFLRGSRGRQRVIVNALGTRVGELSSESEIAGSSLTLTIDERTQRAADLVLAGRKGAIVALDPNNGEIIALSSSPRFDPNMFSGELSQEMWRDLTKGKKLTNRAVQGTFPPGSVFKIFVGLAGLAEGLVKKTDSVRCPGFYWFAGRRYNCWKKTGHGTVAFKDSLVQSCDVYYYMLGQRLGVDRIHRYASDFGLGEKTGLDLISEASGLVPSTEWKRRAHRNPGDKKWYPGETLSVAIGQGAVTVSPLQIARALAAVVNGGIVYRPTLVKSIVSVDGRLVAGPETGDELRPEEQRRIVIPPEVATLVREAMVGVVNDPRGTARRAQLRPELGIKVGGKTGTAQVVGLHHGTKGDLNDHAWFAGYAPVEDPKLVVVALAENGGHGGSTAAPMVQRVMTAFFDREAELLPPDISDH